MFRILLYWYYSIKQSHQHQKWKIVFIPEVRKSHDELFEVDFSIPVVVKYVDNSPALQLDLKNYN